MKTLPLFLFIGCIITARAQNANSSPSIPPLPPGPLIQKRAPDFSQWLVKLPPPPKAANDAGQQKPSWASVVSMTKTGNTLLRQTLDEKNQTWNTWCIGNFQITIWPGGSQWIVGSPPRDSSIPDPLFEDYSQTDFPGFQWISVRNYTGIQDVSGIKCIVFKDRIKPFADEETVMDYTAYINLDTRMPVAIQSITGAHTYEFKSPPAAMLTLPPLVTDLLKNLKTSSESAARKEIRPY